MGWLLSILGIGGIGAALFLVPGLAANALKALGAALDVVRDHPWQCAVAAALCLSGWFWHGKQGETRRADKWHSAWAAMDTAQRAATAYAKAEAARKDTLATDIKDHANDSRKLAQAAGARAGDDYADSHKCVRASAGSRVHADLPRSNTLAGQPEGAAQDVDLVAVGRPDFNTCTASVIDLNNAIDWAEGLRAKGLAK